VAPRDDRPLYALGALALLIAVVFLVPATRAWALDTMIEPLRAQADPAPGLRQGYSFPSLVVWALVGAVLAWVAYELLFVRARFEPDRSFFLALTPALLLGPLLHAALVHGALPRGSLLAYLAAEPLVYLTIGVFAIAGLALGRALHRPLLAPLVLGAFALGPLLVVLLPSATAESARRALILLALALAPALAVAYAYTRWRPADGFATAFAVIAAHALDGATTWMVLRDPFSLGFEGFGERNPLSESLVGLSNGWPFFAVKLALPILLLGFVKSDPGEERLRAFLLFAIFVLGFGPGMANLLQVVFG
jgi:uncharacterized membrane protein